MQQRYSKHDKDRRKDQSPEKNRVQETGDSSSIMNSLTQALSLLITDRHRSRWYDLKTLFKSALRV